MELRGRAHTFGNDVNTDYIISGKYKFKTLDMKELAKHVMEDLDPDFAKRVQEGDKIHRTQPEVWREIENRWEEIFPYVEVDITADFSVEHSGLIGKSLEIR
jgi:hypothetical protein